MNIDKKINTIIKLDDVYAFAEILPLIDNNLKYKLSGKGNKNDDSLFIRACRLDAVEIVKYLLSKNKAGISLVGFITAVLEGSYNVVNLLVSKIKNINFVTEQGFSLLLIATDSNQYKIMELLLKKGADPNIISLDKRAPLHMASQKNISYVKLLLEYGANVNVLDKDNWTPLRQSIVCKKYDITKLLLQNGANDDVIDYKNKTPYDYAIFSENTKLIKLLNRYRIIKQLKSKLIPFLILSRVFAEDSPLHENYLCFDLFKVLIDAINKEIGLRSYNL